MNSLLEAPATVEIKGASYAVEPIAPGFAGVAAVRLVKLVNGESYDVVLQADGLVVCDCPDFVCRHEGKGTRCKHGKAAIDFGLLIPPVSGGSPAVATPPPADAWMGETVALLVTGEGLDLIRAGRIDEAEGIFLNLDREHRDDFFAFLISIGCPVATWSGWLALCRAGSAVGFPLPTAPADFAPTPETEAEWLGYQLGSGGDLAAPLRGTDFPLMVAFYKGFLVGKAELEAESLEFEEWLDATDRPELDYYEMVEAGGAEFARRVG